MRAALIGVSGFAEAHYQELLRLVREGQAKLPAATIINQVEESAKCRFLRSLGCEIFADYREMLQAHAGGLDLCVIPTGIHLHAPMTVAALRAGCHVMVEKPAAATVEEVDGMERAEAESGRFVAVGYQHIYAPEIHRMKRALLDGLIGELQVVKCCGLWPRSRDYYDRNNWAGHLKRGDAWVFDSPFNNAFAHWLNAMTFLAGKEFELAAHPRSVQSELYRARAIESADTACLRVETAERVPLLMYVTHSCANEYGPVLEVRGTEGSLIWAPSQISLHSRKSRLQEWPTGSEETNRRHMYKAVLQKMSKREAFICGLPVARRQTECSVAAFTASEIGNIPASHVECKAAPVIKNIEAICRAAFASELLWSEMAVPWTKKSFRPPVPVRLSSGQTAAMRCCPK